MASVADLVSQMVSLEWMQHQRQRKVGGDRLVREGLGHVEFMFDGIFRMETSGRVETSATAMVLTVTPVRLSRSE